MTLRTSLAWLLLALLGLFQILALTLPPALLLGGHGPGALPALAHQIGGGTALPVLDAAIAAAIVPGTLAAMALWRLRVWGLAASLLLAPLLLPMALLAATDGPAGLAAAVIAHASLGLGIGVGCGLGSLAGLDRGVLRAAACCGVSPLGMIWRVVLPVMAPGMLAAILLSALASLGTSLVGLLHGRIDDIALLTTLPPATWLAASGSAALVCAIAWISLVLLRRS